jgi:hypothetical protein
VAVVFHSLAGAEVAGPPAGDVLGLAAVEVVAGALAVELEPAVADPSDVFVSVLVGSSGLLQPTRQTAAANVSDNRLIIVKFKAQTLCESERVSKEELKMRNHLNLDIRPFRQRSHLDCRTRGKIRCEELRVHLVHAGKIGKVGQEDSALYYVIEPEPLVIENRFHVFQHSLGLSFDVPRDEIARRRIDWDLARAE